MEPTKYHNLYRTTGVFKYIYKGGNFEIGGRDCNDLKFKLAIQGIKLQEKTEEKIKETNVNNIKKEYNPVTRKQIKPVRPKYKSNNIKSNDEPLKKYVDYIESEEDIGFGEYHTSNYGTVTRSWGPDNSKRARKLREDLIK